MKRREFIATSLGVAGGVIPFLERSSAIGGPCPPTPMNITGGTQANTLCVSSSAPAWFVNAPEGQWVEIAKHSEGKSIRSAAPNPIPTNSTDLEGLDSIPNSFGGGVVDQSRGELLMPQRGGHTQYCGNECYALAVRSADPRWYRLIDPTPSSSIPNVASDGGSSYSSGVYNDGRMRTVHGWSRAAFANNRVIHATLDSVFCAGGDGPRRGFAYNRAFPGTPIAPGGTPLAWQNNLGPFEDLGAPPATNDGANYSKGPSVYERNSGLVWTFSGGSYGVGWRLDANTMTYRGAFAATSSNAINPYTSWCVDAFDKGVVIMSMPYVNGAWGGVGVAVFDPANPTTGWYRKSPSNGFGSWMTSGNGQTNYGACYDPINSRIYCFVRDDAAVIKILDVPTNPISSTSWAWRTIRPSGVVPTGTNGAATYGNFGIIENMGMIGGVVRQALVLFTDVDGPSYAMKLPAGGL